MLYGRRAGLVAALLLALMPYHVIVTRQVLLDGPMTMFATLTLLLVVRFVLERPAGVAVRGGRGDGAHLPVQGDEHRAAGRDLRVLRAHAGAARAHRATSRSRWG